MPETCEACRSPEMQMMGTLGHIIWLKCRDCGWQQECGEMDEQIFEDMTHEVCY